MDPSKLKEDENVAKYFSGDLNVPLLKDTLGRVSWATPYALAIYGTDYTQQCPFKTGGLFCILFGRPSIFFFNFFSH